MSATKAPAKRAAAKAAPKAPASTVGPDPDLDEGEPIDAQIMATGTPLSADVEDRSIVLKAGTDEARAKVRELLQRDDILVTTSSTRGPGNTGDERTHYQEVIKPSAVQPGDQVIASDRQDGPLIVRPATMVTIVG